MISALIYNNLIEMHRSILVVSIRVCIVKFIDSLLRNYSFLFNSIKISNRDLQVDREGIRARGFEICPPIEEKKGPVMQTIWNGALNDEFMATQGDALKYGVLKLQSWPDLSQVPETAQPLAARICALLSRKPSASRLVPLVVSVPESDVYQVMAALVRMGHVAVATTAFTQTGAEAQPESLIAAEVSPSVSKFGFVRKSLIGQLWHKLVS